MLFFSEYGQLMYSDGKNCIELFDNMTDRTVEHYRKLGIPVRTGEELSQHRSKFTKAKRDSKEMDTPAGFKANLSEEGDDEFAAIEVAGVDKNGKSLGNHGIRPDASKSTGKVFRTLGGKTMVHSNDCDDEFADIEGNVCKSGRIRSSDRSCRGSVLRRGR